MNHFLKNTNKENQLRGKLWTESHEKQIKFIWVGAILEKLRLIWW